MLYESGEMKRRTRGPAREKFDGKGGKESETRIANGGGGGSMKTLN
jgi:hypothetical protein